MRRMLDTNIVVCARGKRSESVWRYVSRFAPGELCVSSIVLAEFEYGVFNSVNPEKNQLALTLFLASIETVPFDDAAAVEYGRIRADLKRKGVLIGANDLLIAAHAKSLGLTLVTNNTREFARVEGLEIESWAS